MVRDELSVLSAFLAVAEERSFTRAAKRLGVTPSALSHAIRELEERFGVRLLARTTRSETDPKTLFQLSNRVLVSVCSRERRVAWPRPMREHNSSRGYARRSATSCAPASVGATLRVVRTSKRT